MAKYRAFIKANIYPQNEDCNENNAFVIHIPEHISYDTEQKALDSKTRWDYSFGFDNKNVVILIRHVTVVDDGYIEIRNMPEYCYDYNTFVKLGGWIEHITRKENVVNIVRINEDFNHLYINLLNDIKTQIKPTDITISHSNKSYCTK